MSTNSIPDILWHYCSPETFELILANKSIRLSDITNCLDKLEIRYAKRKYRLLLNKDVRSIIKKYPKRSQKWFEAFSGKRILRKLSSKHICFVFCLSERDDIEGHWNIHACEKTGVSVGFNLNALVNNVSKIELLTSKVFYKNNLIKSIYKKKNASFHKILSDTFDKYTEIARNLKKTTRMSDRDLFELSNECYSRVIDLLLPDFASFKRHKFEWEQEWRLLLTSTNVKKSFAAKNIYLQKKDCFKCWWYVSFDLIDAIKAITIGEESKLTVDYVKNFLKTKCSLTPEEIKNITIKKL